MSRLKFKDVNKEVYFEFEAGAKDNPKEVEIYIGGYFLCSVEIKNISAEAKAELFEDEVKVELPKVWFEIGMKEESGETHSVYKDDTLAGVIEEFKEQKYDKEKYFIDVWELEADDCPVPVANIDLSSI